MKLAFSHRQTLVSVAAATVFFLPLSGKPPAPLPDPARKPLVRVVDLNLGETADLELANGAKARVKLLKLSETRDALRNAVREAQVTVEVNGQPITLAAGNYNLPRTVARVQIDCPITKGYNANTTRDAWGLEKDARLRLWPVGSPLLEPGTFVYPLKQRWFATQTQMANEPTYVDGGEQPQDKSIYYHNDLDFGGCEGVTEVVAATDGLVVSSAGQTLPGYQDTPAQPRYDVVYVLDARGWYYRYSHLFSIDDAIKPGATVKLGQKIGVLGKEGASGGWSHLHFGIVSRQPSGKWGTQEAYAFVWEAYLREYKPQIMAVARPHHLAAVGEKVRLDAAKSWSAAGRITRYQWQFHDGARARGAVVERTYSKPGTFSEILRVEDARGNVAYDFAVVQILDAANPAQLPPTIHPSYAPTTGIRPGDRITFKVRTFRTTEGAETWDFGDGTAPVTVKSDGNARVLAKDGYAVTEHAYQQPGTYLVRVTRANARGETATGHLAVTVARELAAARPPSLSAAKGPLRVHPTNPRYFTDGTKDKRGALKVVYLTGSHTWNSLVDMGRSDPPEAFDFDAYLAFLARHGHNFIRLWTWDSFTWDSRANVREGNGLIHRVAPLPWATTGPGQALDGHPKFDLTKFNPVYFERLRARVSAAGRRGIYVSVMLFEGWGMYHANRRRTSSEGWAWRSHPFHPDNNINGIDAGGAVATGGPHRLGNQAVNAAQAAYIRKVVDTVNDLDNVLYEVINEGGDKEWDWWVAKTIRDHERTKPKQHPIGITGHGAENLADMLASPADWISPGKKDGYGEEPPAWDGKKVSLLDTDHIWGVGGNAAWAWKSFLRGHNPIFMDPYDNRILGKGQADQWDALRRSLGHTRRLAERVNLAALTPHNELASTKYCLAQPGVAYIIYLPEGAKGAEGGAVTVNLAGTSGSFQVEWIHPVEGTVTKAAAVAGGGSRVFKSPFNHDAVLRLWRNP